MQFWSRENEFELFSFSTTLFFVIVFPVVDVQFVVCHCFDRGHLPVMRWAWKHVGTTSSVFFENGIEFALSSAVVTNETTALIGSQKLHTEVK